VQSQARKNYNAQHRKRDLMTGIHRSGSKSGRVRSHIELHMAPIRHEVNIAMEPYLGIVQGGRSLNDYAYLVQCREATFDHLVWWGEALKAARQKASAASGIAA